MVRGLSILVGLATLIVTGVVHGLWTERWQVSEELLEATRRLEDLPDSLGAWQGSSCEQDAEALAMAGATGHYSRSFLDPETGDRILVILLVGRAARMAVHRPEHCYQAAGYKFGGRPGKLTVRVPEMPAAEFFTGLFTREEADGPSQLRILWSFGCDGRWEAPDNPRVQFARKKSLYKLYLVRETGGSPVNPENDPCVRLLSLLLPALGRTLSGR